MKPGLYTLFEMQSMPMQLYTFVNSFVVVYTNSGILYRLFCVVFITVFPGDSSISVPTELPYSFYGYMIFYVVDVSKFIYAVPFLTF